jgi:hypothetical protein
MSDPAEQNFPSGDIKVVTAGHTESHAGYRNKQSQHESKEVLAFPGQKISAIAHSVKFLFAKFTFLFTILMPQAEIYQSNFVESILIGYEK